MSDTPSGNARVSTTNGAQPGRLSDRLRALDTGADTTFGAIVDALGDQAFGATMFVFAAPNLVPNPPGTSPILGLPLLFLSVQLLLGRETVWFPGWLRSRTVSRSFLSTLSQRVVPVICWLERALKPRLSAVVSTPAALRLAGAVALPLAAILLLPLPFLHILPGAAMTALAAGLAERDGAALLVGYILALAALAVFITLGFAVHSGVASILAA